MAGFPVAPPGLEYLLQVNELSVKEKSQGIFEGCNTYDFFGIDGELVYQATQQEECCGPEIECRVTNTQGYNVLNILEPLECCACDTKLQVSSSSGELLGYIMEQWTSFTLSFDILDPSGLVCLKVKGPGWGEDFMSDTKYMVLSADKTTQIGVITHVWRGLCKELFSNKDNYIIHFPVDLHVSMKAMLMACALFIEFLIEKRNRQQRSRS